MQSLVYSFLKSNLHFFFLVVVILGDVYMPFDLQSRFKSPRGGKMAVQFKPSTQRKQVKSIYY